MSAVKKQEHIAVVGAGPAAIRAAELLHSKGCTITLIHEGPKSGGNIYKQQPEGFVRKADELYGSESQKAKALHQTFDVVKAGITVCSDTTVWNAWRSELYLHGPDGVKKLPYDRLLTATGAMDRVIPLPGWTLPGAFTLGGSQIALKHQACSIGRNVIFFGTGPLLYLVAYQYIKAGAHVAGVFDTSSFWSKAKASMGMLTDIRALRLGMRYRSYIKSSGVAFAEGITPLEISGEENVSGFRFKTAAGAEQFIDCDAVAFGYGLKPESQLPELLGAKMTFEPQQRVWQVEHDGNGRAGNGLYVAGDGTTIGGADVAELTGELAAFSILKDMGHTIDQDRVAGIQHVLGQKSRFRTALNAAFPVPVEQIKALPDETILCRCENITVGEIRSTIKDLGPHEINQLKAYCRPGMGRCQGRICGLSAAELLAQETGKPIEEVGLLRGQAPIKPLPYDVAAELVEDELGKAIKEELLRG